MNYLIVDDEPIILNGMKRVLRNVVGEQEKIFTADNPFEALDIIKNNSIDIMFCDVDMPEMNGLNLVQRVQEISEKTDVIFATGYAHYSLDAWKTSAQAFILKPVGEEEIRDALDRIFKRNSRGNTIGNEVGVLRKIKTVQTVEEKPLKAMCFGNFEIFYNGSPVRFTRKKSKEMLAYLVDRRGAVISTDQIRAVLWEEDVDTEEKQGYVRVLANDIRKAFANVGINNFLINEQNSYCIDTTRLSCDYYDYLDGDIAARRGFHEEYMMQYSWGEVTLGRLLNMK